MTSLLSSTRYPSGGTPPIHIPFLFEAAILSRMRSPMTSRSNCAKDSRTLRVKRPIEVVVLNCCVTETNEAPLASRILPILAKSANERVSRSILYTTTMSIRPAVISASSRCRAGRSIVAPEKPPSSKAAGRHTQPSWRWLLIKASQASRCACRLSFLSSGSICSPEHLVPGAAPVSSQRLQASAEHCGPVLNHPVEHRGNAQSATFSGLPLSAIPTKPSPGKLAAAPNPHRRPSPHPLSRRFVLRWLSYAGLLTGPPLAPGRHPKPFPIPDLPTLARNGEVRNHSRRPKKRPGIQTEARKA